MNLLTGVRNVGFSKTFLFAVLFSVPAMTFSPPASAFGLFDGLSQLADWWSQKKRNRSKQSSLEKQFKAVYADATKESDAHLAFVISWKNVSAKALAVATAADRYSFIAIESETNENVDLLVSFQIISLARAEKLLALCEEVENEAEIALKSLSYKPLDVETLSSAAGALVDDCKDLKRRIVSIETVGDNLSEIAKEYRQFFDDAELAELLAQLNDDGSSAKFAGRASSEIVIELDEDKNLVA